MKTELVQTTPGQTKTELLAVFAADEQTGKGQTVKPLPALLTTDETVKAAAAAVLSSGEFKAGLCETLLLHAPTGVAAKRLLIVGVGKAATFGPHELRKAAGAAVRAAKPRSIRSVALVLPPALDAATAARATTEGALLADYDPDTYRSNREDKSVAAVQLLLAHEANLAAAENGFREGNILADAQNFARTLVNEPGNVLTPTELGRRAAAMASASGLTCEVYSTEKLHELKMGAFWSVSQGSVEPPALIVMTYEPEGGAKEGAPVLALVGKGITFDTGGISLKPADGMEKMKYDMAGAAAMIGSMQAIAALKPRVKVIGVVCSAENMPSGTAQKPGDVQTAMSGKTIEIINTDAEGRLVLADGLAYAKQLGATHLIDAATLTGACVVALGQINAGVFANDEEAYGKFSNAFSVSGEKFWRLPVEDDYRDQIRSQIADIRNTGGSRWGGAITAAMFLKEFAEDTPWIHLDIAGVAWIEDNKPWIAAGPSGVGVRTIVEWVRSF